ncbi:uncharacterized protein LOC143913395 isoform X2 [Arctopsyche grandis]|uniref:uncharacterized protein LOC143913395 isoform X2 n=1 Tax=Arctopsyche grandis TaxID=121162 RepID=UPI00406D671D
MSVRWSEDVTMKFVTEYVKHECLWDARTEEYKSKQARQAAYAEIEDVMGIEGFGPKEIVKKIKNIRSTYSQELKKVKDAKKSGTGSLYIPSLKWYATLDKAVKLVAATFKKPQTSNNRTTDEDIVANEELFHPVAATYTVCSDVIAPTINTESASFPNKRRKVQEYQSVLAQLKGVSDSLNTLQVENEFQIFGRHIGAQLKNMPLFMALQAQQHIQNYLNDIRLQALSQSSPRLKCESKSPEQPEGRRDAEFAGSFCRKVKNGSEETTSSPFLGSSTGIKSSHYSVKFAKRIREFSDYMKIMIFNINNMVKDQQKIAINLILKTVNNGHIVNLLPTTTVIIKTLDIPLTFEVS